MKTTILKRTLEGIDTLEYTSKKADKLMFLQHGIHGNKQKIMHLLGLSFVKLGYHVIAIDAAKHGSRLEEPFASKDEDLCELDTMNVVKTTALDIRAIHDNHFKKEFAAFDIIGVSMGGLIGYYLSTITDRIDQLVAMISSPDFKAAALYKFPPERRAKYPEKSAEAERLVDAMNPAERTEEMTFNRLIMVSGEHDRVIPYSHSERFKQDNPDRDIIFTLYDTDHSIVKAMHDDILRWLKTARRK